MAADVGILDQVTQEFLHALQRDRVFVEAAAKHLFYYLVVIQLALTAIWMTLVGESLNRFITRLVQLAFSFGIFYGLIQCGGVWIPEILNGFVQLGQQAGVTSLDPSSIVDQGISISVAILKGFFSWGLLSHPFVAIIGAVICMAILVLYGLMAAELAIALVKTYLLISTGGLFFAFGASDYTQEMAKKYFNAIIGLGLYLMTLYFLLGVGQHVGSTWAAMSAQAAEQHQLTPMLVILAAVIVYYMLLKNIPPFVAGLSGVGGFRNYGDAAVGMAINAGLSGVNTLSSVKQMAGKRIQGMTQLGQGAMQMSKSFAQGMSQSSGWGVMSSGLKTAGSHAIYATGNTVKDLALRQNQHLTSGQKFNSHLANKIKSGKQEG